MALIERELDFSIRLAPKPGTNQPATFSESGTDTTTISGLRASVQIANSGSPAGNSASIKIYGMPPSLMNQLSTLGMVFNIVPNNAITVLAGDKGSRKNPVFVGTIQSAYATYDEQPDVGFQISAISGLADQVNPATPQSFAGSASAETVMASIARSMNKGFENNGVDVQLSNVYLRGSLMEQAKAVAEWGRFEFGFVNEVMVIFPRGGARSGGAVPEISMATGMIQSPAFTQQGIMVKTLFNPQISFGGKVKVISDVIAGLAATGTQRTRVLSSAQLFPSEWAVYQLDLSLASKMPGGDWMSVVYCYNPNYPKPVMRPAR